MLAFASIVFVVVAAGQLKAAGINCERFREYGIYKKCCFLNETTEISAVNSTIAGLEASDVDAILFENNNKIQFLPVSVYRKFPNLIYFSARNASVKEISALNFERLPNLKILDLAENEIEFIPNYCFEGLTKLNEILLNINKIAKMEGTAFANLPQLVLLDLRDNVCVSRHFATASAINIFRRRISRNCAASGEAKKAIQCKNLLACNELINMMFEKWYKREGHCCELEYGTHIDSPDYSFAVDTNYNYLEIIYVTHQRYVDFLPILIHERFKHLKFYIVIDTPIQKVSKKNFEAMFELESLHLESNHIEVIKSDTFEDLIMLRRIALTRQRLTALNGQAFAKLTKLRQINLDQNYCIDRTFGLNEIKKVASEEISSSCGFDEFNSTDIYCEKYQECINSEFNHYRLSDCCFVNTKTIINDINFVIADLKDEEVEGIVFEYNKEIECLPYKIFMQLPNLVFYKARGCSIKRITKENFEGLSRIQSIDLRDNKIQKISGNTFKGLKSLEFIYLNQNEITSINGRTFDEIPLLSFVNLSSNKCIDEILRPGQSIKMFTRKIIKNCAFTETGLREFEKVFDIECGVGLGGSGFIVGGNETKRGQWPFKVALIFEPKNMFFCGGSIITKSHVLTAAHCIQNKFKKQPFDASQILVLLGRYDLSLRAEDGSEVRGIKEIKVHPHWNHTASKYEGDIAVLELNQAVQFSDLIKPVCLTVESEMSEREAGYVVGWGRSEKLKRHEDIPRQVLTSSVTTDVCFDRDYMLGSMYSQGMYCAGGDGAGPCTGDSGGGYFVWYYGLWTLRGIVSSGTTNSENRCDVGRYSLYTNVLDYTEWISDAVKKSETLPALPSIKDQSAFGEEIKIPIFGPTRKSIGVSQINTSRNRTYLRRDQGFGADD